MKCKEILVESLSYPQAKSTLKKFITFVKGELKLNSLPIIKLTTSSKNSVSQSSFGGYNTQDKTIRLSIGQRHIMDVCRTLCHELVHYQQDLANELDDNSGQDGSPQENQANALAAVIMRRWGKLNPTLFDNESIETV